MLDNREREVERYIRRGHIPVLFPPERKWGNRLINRIVAIKNRRCRNEHNVVYGKAKESSQNVSNGASEGSGRLVSE